MFPLWLKVAYTLFVCVVIPVYWFRYGADNFLWFSDIALFLTAPAFWLESGLLTSMVILSILILDLAWNIDFFGRLATGRNLLGLSEYMFDATIPRPVRLLSLFHIWFPPLLLWMVSRLGYDERAFAAQSVLAWLVLPVTYLVTNPRENINWVHGPLGEPQKWMPPRIYLALLMVLLPLFIYLPTHLVLEKLMP
jgi:hypothetical protein